MDPEAPRSRAVLGRDALLDAAEAVVLRESIGHLTLDAVAAEAGASKGGLMHHFPSKEKLAEAMVERIVANWREDVLAAIDAETGGAGRVPSAILKMALSRPKEWTEQCRRSSVVLIAALVTCPRLVEPMRVFHRELMEMVARDGLPKGVGEAVVLAIDGLWFKWIFGLEELGGDRSHALRGVLGGLIAGGRPVRGAGSVVAASRRSKRGVGGSAIVKSKVVRRRGGAAAGKRGVR